MPHPDDTLEEILSRRQNYQDYWQEAHSRWDMLIQAYHGNFHELWPGEFRRGEIPKVANWIKLGWDRYATMVGKLPTNHVAPSTLRRVSQTKADKIEKILSGYDEVSQFQTLMKRHGWFLIGLGASCVGVMPDGITNGPKFFVRDPRTFLPAPGSGSTASTSNMYGSLGKPLMSPMSLHSGIISETVTATYLWDKYGENPNLLYPIADLLNQADSLSTPHVHIIHMDKDRWQVVVDEKLILDVEHGLGFVPARLTTMDVPDQLGGQSQFEQNIGLVLAHMRILNQKLTYNENVVWPWLVLKGLTNTNPDERTIEIMDRDGDAQFLSPPSEIQSERDLDTLDRLIRVMNHDTEAMQGTAPGSIVTGRSVVELNRDVGNTVQAYWDKMAPDLEFVKSAALAIDESLYGSRKKTMTGKQKGETFEETYTPAKDIAGNHSVKIDFGIGVGGLEGFVELMQVAAQGLVDEQTVMENLPWVTSVSDTRKRVFLDRIEKIVFEMVGQGAPPQIINHMTLWRDGVQGGKDPWDWITENPIPAPEPDPMQLPPEAGGIPGGEGAPPQIPNIPSPSQILALGQGRSR